MLVHLTRQFYVTIGRSLGQTRQHNLKSTKRVGGQDDPPQHNFAHNFRGVYGGGAWGPGPPGVTKGAPKRKKKRKGKERKREGRKEKRRKKKEKKKKEGARKKKERKLNQYDESVATEF